MSVILGVAGSVELTRNSDDQAFESVVNSSDVNPTRNHFSCDFPEGALLTGDQLEIKTTDGSVLSFVTGWPYPDGKWFIHVNRAGGVMLYENFDDAVAGEAPGRVDLQLPAKDLPIALHVRSNVARCLGEVVGFELNTSRDAVDVTELGEEFHRQHATLISGSGTLSCFFDYRHEMCDGMAQDVELGVYMHQLILRQQLGSAFKARLFMVNRGYGHDVSDEVWYEFEGLVTNVGIAFEPTQPVRSKIDFVTTGEVKLRVRTDSYYVLQEDFGRLALERSQGSGFVELEQDDE